MNRALIHDLATARFILPCEDVLFPGPPGTGKSDLAQAIGRAAIHQGHRVLYREAHTLLEELADATLDGTRKAVVAELTTVPLLIIDDLGMRTPPHTAADLLKVIMRRYERASTLLTSNRPVDDWSKLLGDSAAVTALLDRLLHHTHVLKCGPPQLADEGPGRLAPGGGHAVELTRLGRQKWPGLPVDEMAGLTRPPRSKKQITLGALRRINGLACGSSKHQNGYVALCAGGRRLL